MTSRKRDALERISRLGRQGLDVDTFLMRASEAVAAALPASSVCWYTLDPESVLVTSYRCENWDLTPAFEREMLAWEYFEDDFNKAADVVRSSRGIQTLEEATGGDPSRSRAYREWMQPMGLEHEVLIAIRTRGGHNWGVMSAAREVGEPGFNDVELGFLLRLSPHLGNGIQRGMLVGEASDPDGSEPPALLVLNDDLSVHSATPGVDHWLADLPGRWEKDGLLPPCVVAVAAPPLRSAGPDDEPGEVAVSRVLSRSGRWIVLHGAPMVSEGTHRAAIIIEPAAPARLTNLLMAAYGLTEREEEVARLVLRGHSTAEMAESLFVSPHTVREHLKSIFDKTDVRSRRELVGRVFFSHYEPRVQDNQRRVLTERPVRGGPFPLDAELVAGSRR